MQQDIPEHFSVIIFKLLNINWPFIYWLVNPTTKLKFLIKYVDGIYFHLETTV